LLPDEIEFLKNNLPVNTKLWGICARINLRRYRRQLEAAPENSDDTLSEVSIDTFDLEVDRMEFDASMDDQNSILSQLSEMSDGDNSDTSDDSLSLGYDDFGPAVQQRYEAFEAFAATCPTSEEVEEYYKDYGTTGWPSKRAYDEYMHSLTIPTVFPPRRRATHKSILRKETYFTSYTYKTQLLGKR
jgi:hypothetical protein